jgi:ribosomal protein S19
MPLSVASLLLAATVAACGGSRTPGDGTRMPEQTIDAVLAMHNDSLMALPGVVGTAIGLCDGTPCIRVFVRDSVAARGTQLGEKLGGYPLRVEVTGTFHAR